jgi:hypothetical protein
MILCNPKQTELKQMYERESTHKQINIKKIK